MPKHRWSVSATADAGKMDALTTIRFFGAVYVALGHWLNPIPVISHQRTLWHFIAFARCAVSGFFLLSGFILAWVYLRDGKTINKRQFYVSRFARIYPVFLLTLIADCPWYFWSHIAKFGVRGALIKTGISFASSLFMLQAWGRSFWGLNLPSWSLSVETLFYAIFPFLGVLLWRVRKRWIWPAILLVYVGGQLIVLFVLKAAESHPVDPDVLLFFPPLHVSTFLLGILLAKLRVHADRDQRPQKRAWTTWVLFTSVVVTCFALAVMVPSSMIESPTGHTLIQDGALSPIFCGLIWVISDKTTPVSRLLSAKWLILLGEASYGLYLIHDPVLHVTWPILFHALRNVTWREFKVLYLLSFPVYLALCIALSVACYLWFEVPARKWIRSRFGSRPATTAGPGTRVMADNLTLADADLQAPRSV
jgi:peptidoglycan/LPS O-acetylase OafA/YrhL